MSEIVSFALTRNFIPPVVGATIAQGMDFRERVIWYAEWIKLNPMSHIHFQVEGTYKGFVSERHVNL
jgi:hypothetical protein